MIKKLNTMDQKHPIAYQARINHLSMLDMCRALNCSAITLRSYIDDPYLMRMRDMMILSGLFGIKSIELFYLLQRNKPSNKTNKEAKWYLKDLEDRMEFNIKSI